MITLSRSKSSGSPATPGKETATCPIPTSATRAGIPHPVIVSLMSARVKLSPPMRNSAASAAASSLGWSATGRRTNSWATRSTPQLSAVTREVSRWISSSASVAPSRLSPWASSSPPLKAASRS